MKKRKEILLEQIKDRDDIPLQVTKELMVIHEYESLVEGIRIFIQTAPLTMNKAKCRKHFTLLIEHLETQGKSLLVGEQQRFEEIKLVNTLQYKQFLKDLGNRFVVAWLREKHME